MISRISGWARILLSLGLLVILAKVLVETFWLFFLGPSEPVAVPEHLFRLEAVTQEKATRVSREEVALWHLFGEKTEEVAVVEEEIKEAPDTRLSLELVGLFSHMDKAKATAVIAEKGKSANLFRVGDKLPSNVEVVEIYADRVILRRQGKHETLRMKESNLGNSVAINKVSSASLAPVQRRPVRKAEVREPQIASNSNTSAAFVIPGESPQQQRQMIITELALQPVSESSAEGYVIGDGAPAALIGAVGLRVGDQIVSVNGQMLGEEQQDVAILNDVLVSGTATIEVVRGTRRFTVNYPP